jgi:hypothetical protein
MSGHVPVWAKNATCLLIYFLCSFNVNTRFFIDKRFGAQAEEVAPVCASKDDYKAWISWMAGVVDAESGSTWWVPGRAGTLGQNSLAVLQACRFPQELEQEGNQPGRLS